MLGIIAIVLLVLWLGGFSLHLLGGAIHLLLIVALVLVIMHFFKGGKNNNLVP